MFFSIFLSRLPLENMLLNLRSMFDMWRQEINQGICNLNFKVKYESSNVFHNYGQNDCNHGKGKLQMGFMTKLKPRVQLLA